MKLLDPFAGYRLASGHAFFHVALFTSSWFINPISKSGDEDLDDSSELIEQAFMMLRWSHFWLFMLATLE